jgi:class 3 adenylate cyclase
LPAGRPKFERKSAAIFSADVVGFCALMATDELATLAALLASQRRVAYWVEHHGGRVVDSPGDNILAEFNDVRAALRCAVRIQRSSASRKDPRRLRIQFRIGLHSGEILVNEGRVYGDVVNVAARLQMAAEPGGILLSAATARGLDGRARRSLVDLGDEHFKNIPYPVRVLRHRSRAR